MMSLARDYPARHGVSEAVAFATVVDRHPELFTTAKMPPAMSRAVDEASNHSLSAARYRPPTLPTP